MPAIRKRVTSTSSNILSAEKNRYIGPKGAYVSVFAAGVTNSDDIGLSINTREIIPPGTDISIEVSADVIDRSRDALLLNEFVEQGEMSMPVTVTTELQVLIDIKPL